MTELRRSSRVRQSAKRSPQYYEPDEKKGILAAPDVRPRKWRAADVAVGYFTLRKWVPKDQQHLTADLHGGLTDKAEIVAAAKLALRSGNRTFTRGRSRSRGGSSGGLSRGRGGSINRAGGRSSPGDSSGASFGGAGAGGWGGAQGYAPPPPGPSVPPTAATGGGAFLGGAAASGMAQSRVLQQPEGVSGKRPAAAVVGGTSEHEPPLQSRRISDDSSPRLPGPAGARSSAGAPLGPWAGQAQSLGTTQLGNGLVRGGQAGETACLAGGTAVGAGRGVGAMWGAGGATEPYNRCGTTPPCARFPAGGMPEGNDGVSAPPQNVLSKVVPLEEGTSAGEWAPANGEAVVKQEVPAAESSTLEQAPGVDEVAIPLQEPVQIVDKEFSQANGPIPVVVRTPPLAQDPPRSLWSLENLPGGETEDQELASSVVSDISTATSLDSPQLTHRLGAAVTPDGKEITGRCLTYKDRQGGTLETHHFSDKLHYSYANISYRKAKGQHPLSCTVS